MKQVGWILGMTILLLHSCGGGTEPAAQGTPVAPAEMFFVENRTFSDPALPDQFTIGYYGTDLLDTLVYFRILNGKGDTLHTVEWPARNFLDGIPDPGTDSLRVAEVMRQMQALVHETTVPDSLKAALPPLPEGVTRAFVYRLGAQPPFRICWSPAQRRVIPG